MKKLLNKQLLKIEKKEQKILNKKPNKLIKENLTPFKNKIEAKIPDKLKKTMHIAFYKGFQVVFEKGTKYIEKTYNKEEINIQHDVNNYYIDRNTSKKSIRAMDIKPNKSRIVNKSIATIEGAGLGLLGLGLPDIPLLISVILKTIYEISLSYGFNYESNNEKIYILNLISAAVTTEEVQGRYNTKVDELAVNIDFNGIVNENLDDEMKETSHNLFEVMVTSKFIQGIPIIGVVGSITNYNVVNKIGKYASLKYKKRYLNKK
ncbi:EcsC family protein [Clostridium gasigenes]|uniref:EcsC family protein n=1 Tax=Clostridium gasigenes TaxID=94869 RepID=UPI001C0D51B5|nr:EcsC family protein [Clostridium gasigenes]MBU3107063.1 EcsC family protein [Clostridium gasigenes]